MNAETKDQLAAVASTEIATLPPAARAAVVLKSEETRKQLAELVTKSAAILSVTNMAGRDEAHRAGMVLKTTRVAIEKTGKQAREDATAFSKAVIAVEKELIDLIAPEETRVLALRDQWDAQVEAERQAKIAAERDRMARIASAIEGIRERETDLVRLTKTADQARAEIDNLDALAITEEIYQERHAEAVELKTNVLASMYATLATRIEAEQAEAKRLADIEAENKRIAEERAELARQMAQAAERNRIESERLAAERAKAEQEAAAARLAIQQERARLAEVAAEQEREAAAVRAEADRAAKMEAARVQAEHDKAAAALKAQQDALARQQAEFDARVKAEADAKAAAEAEAIAAAQAEREALEVPATLPPPESYPTDSLPPPDAETLVTLVMGEYDADYETALGWLVAADFASLVKMA